MEITTKTFAEFAADQKNHPLGMVVLGAGPPHQKWVEGIAELLHEREIVTSVQCFDTAYTLNDNVEGKEGRTDLVIYFSAASKPNIGKLAIWRLLFGSVSWTDDFIDNHASDYKSGNSPNPLV